MKSRTRGLVCVGVVIGALGLTPAMAAEHGGKEHAGQEHGGQPMTQAPAQVEVPVSTPAPVEPTAEQIRDTISKYVQDTSQEEGAFYVDDEVTGETRELTLDHVHERVGKTGEYYYSCADMKDTKSGDLVDVDFDVEAADGVLDVVDVRIHKVNGKERYTYDENDNRIPVPE